MGGSRPQLKKRLCVFYKYADRFVHDKIEWIVCQKCQRDIRMGRIILPAVSQHKVENLEDELKNAMEYYDAE